MPKFVASEYYDGGLIRLDDIEVPSKRVGYKKENGVLIANVPFGVREFEAAIRETFSSSNSDIRPLKGRLLVGIHIMLPKSSYKSKDVDNMAKSILDSFCGIAYEDDRQIDALYVTKNISDKWQVWIALKSIDESAGTWFLEPMMRIQESSH